MAGLADSYSQGTVGHVLTTSPSSPSSPLALLQVCVLAGRSEMCWLLLKPFLFPQERETHRLPPPPPPRKALRGSDCSPASPSAGQQAELLVGKLRHRAGQLHPKCHKMLMAGQHPPQERGLFAVPHPAPTPGVQQDTIFLSQAFVSIPAGNGCQAWLVFV